MRLTPDIVALLRALEKDEGAALMPLTDAPKLVFEFNLVARLPSGELQLTKTGARALFQAACIDALENAEPGTAPAMDNDVDRWLTSSGFLHPTTKTITPRGKLWLASLTPPENTDTDRATAPDNDARRSAA